MSSLQTDIPQTAPWISPHIAPGTRPVGTLLATRDLFKSYRKGPLGIPVLQGIDMTVREGEFLAIVGQSGCGKSTLLHLLGIDHLRLTYKHQGRRYRLTDVHGEVVEGLLA